MKNCQPFLLRIAVIVSAIFLLNKTFAQSRFTKLVWADEFNYTGLPDSAKWGYDKGKGCPENCGWGNNELQYYTNNRLENARVEKGKLIIEAKKESFEGAAYTSTRLVSKNKGDWKYGRFEIKAKLPAGRGMWPAIWMLPTKWEYGGWPKSGEIDIMENVGYWPDSALSTVHTDAYNGMINTQKTAGVNRKDLSTAFHVYTLEWTAEKMTFSIDNKKYNVFKNAHKTSAEWPFDKEFHMLMNVAVGGNWGGKYGVDDTIFPQKMEIDYVRVYQ
jgi:beta-glucanase (GH16 family)